MSLLLDALKKAAQDKIARGEAKAQNQNVAEHNDINNDDRTSAVTEGISHDNRAATKASEDASETYDARILKSIPEQMDIQVQSLTETVKTENTADKFEFSLDAQTEDYVSVQSDDTRSNDSRTVDSGIPDVSVSSGRHTVDDKASIAALHTTVTDEALQLLIHKSNVEHRKRKYAIWGGVIIGSAFTLMLAGLYFYIDMEDEIDAMQIKNRQALAALVAQTKIEEHLTSLATPVVIPEKSKTTPVKRQAEVKPHLKQETRQKQTITVKKTEKRDPINTLLSKGWSTFQRGDYDESSTVYTEILRREAHNRDALLGAAAVASKRGQTEKAREYYLTLLELDPLDPYAHTGLASISQQEGTSISESRLKQLIEKQPDGAHLQYVLGNLYAAQDKWPQAQQAYFHAWQSDSDNADYAFNLAVSLDHLKKYNEAERFYLNCIELADNGHVGFSVIAVENRLQQLRKIK